MGPTNQHFLIVWDIMMVLWYFFGDFLATGTVTSGEFNGDIMIQCEAPKIAKLGAT